MNEEDPVCFFLVTFVSFMLFLWPGKNLWSDTSCSFSFSALWVRQEPPSTVSALKPTKRCQGWTLTWEVQVRKHGSSHSMWFCILDLHMWWAKYFKHSRTFKSYTTFIKTWSHLVIGRVLGEKHAWRRLSGMCLQLLIWHTVNVLNLREMVMT